MSKFELYNLVLKDLTDDSSVYDFVLNDEYFKKIDSPEVQKGNINAKIIVRKKINSFELQFALTGTILIPCDRCLDEMVQPINCKEKLMVKFGSEFSEENEIVIVPEAEGAINVAWFLYEFIVLSIPMKHVHLPGECNKTMVSKLRNHTSKSKDEVAEDDLEEDDDDDFEIDDNNQIDPRWDSLKNIIDNN